jgi:hypothetical protein
MTTSIPITRRALIQRINRKLPEGEKLKCSRGAQTENELGAYYTVDECSNTVTASHIDLEKWASELKVLKPYERLVD